MLVLRGRNDDGVYFFPAEEFLDVLRRVKLTAVGLLGGGCRALKVHFPKIANAHDLDIPGILKLRKDVFESAPSVSDTNMAKQDTVVCPDDPAIRKRRLRNTGLSCCFSEQGSPQGYGS